MQILSTEGRGVCLCWALSKPKGPTGPRIRMISSSLESIYVGPPPECADVLLEEHGAHHLQIRRETNQRAGADPSAEKAGHGHEGLEFQETNREIHSGRVEEIDAFNFGRHSWSPVAGRSPVASLAGC